MLHGANCNVVKLLQLPKKLTKQELTIEFS